MATGSRETGRPLPPHETHTHTSAVTGDDSWVSAVVSATATLEVRRGTSAGRFLRQNMQRAEGSGRISPHRRSALRRERGRFTHPRRFGYPQSSESPAGAGVSRVRTELAVFRSCASVLPSRPHWRKGDGTRSPQMSGSTRSERKSRDHRMKPVNSIDSMIQGPPHGPIPVRRYSPPLGMSPPSSTPNVWIHGGGFFKGSLDQPESHEVARLLAAAGFKVVTVD